MKKVKLLQDLPPMYKGNIYTLIETHANALVEGKLAEWIEEDKSLIDKWKDSCMTFGETTKWDVLEKIARDHFLEIFDKETKSKGHLFNRPEDIRKALEDG